MSAAIRKPMLPELLSGYRHRSRPPRAAYSHSLLWNARIRTSGVRTRLLRAASISRSGVSAGRCGMDSLSARRWWARASLGLAVLAAAVLLAFAGRRGVWLVLLT